MQPTTNPFPGTIVSVPVLVVYRHRGIVSDRYIGGRPCVITTALGKGVVEEPWAAFGPAHLVNSEGYPSTLPYWEVLHRARQHLGRAYDVFGFNCDHLVAEAHGLPVQSPQLRATLAAAGLFALGSRALV